MASSPDKQRRRFLRDAYKNAERAARTALITIDRDQLDELLDEVDAKVIAEGCDHTSRFAEAWAERNDIDWLELADGLEEFGGFCDCEIVMNVDPEEIFD